MNPSIPIAMFGWIPLVLGLFAKMRAHWAVIAGFLLAWMFLPQFSFSLPGLPDYSKVSAASLGILLGTAVFNAKAFGAFRFQAADVPMLAWCIQPVFTSVSNGLGIYEGLSFALDKVFLWGIPWFIGRIYFNTPGHLRDLALGLFIGGLIYVPFCLFEVAMSPRLHRMLYGFHAHSFGQARRGGGWRPVVFMEHGLMVAMWMTTACLCGLTLLTGGGLRRMPAPFRRLLWPLWVVLLVTTFLCKSTGAIFLLLLGTAVFFGARLLRSRLPFFVLLSLPLLYMGLRGTGSWTAQNLVDAAGGAASAERAGSLEYRIQNENILVEKALERPWLGWGRYRRSYVRDENDEVVSVPDGLWVLSLGRDGVLGLTAMTATLMLPCLMFLRRFPPREWRRPEVAAMVGLPLVMGLFMIDNLFNNMFNPAMLLAGGGMAGLAAGASAEMEGRAEPESGPPRTRAL